MSGDCSSSGECQSGGESSTVYGFIKRFVTCVVNGCDSMLRSERRERR